MGHEMIGTATIDGAVTSIRKYDNGFYVVEVNQDVKYSGETLKELKDKLDKDKIIYNITQES